jgi:cytochrome c peroxidase
VTLREQVLQPIQNPIEMHESLANAVAKIAADRDYHRLFAKAFGTTEITSDRIARALEQFLLVQVSFDSKFDRVMNGTAKFTDAEQRGFTLFNTEYDPYHGQHGADCFHCHGGPMLQSQSFANNGLDSAFRDLGRYKVTKRAGDEGKFAVPSLRNVAVTAPYMHDGRFRTLEEVVEHYCTGIRRSPTLDPNLAKHPDGGVPLSEEDKGALVAFLKTLTDQKFLPVGPPVKLAQR